MDGIKAMEVTGKIVELLQPLSPEERQRILQASLTLLGDAGIEKKQESSGEPSATNDVTGHANLPIRARTWVKQNGISSEQLDQLFHIEDGQVQFIAAEVPG